jgi:hypothetical protein
MVGTRGFLGVDAVATGAGVSFFIRPLPWGQRRTILPAAGCQLADFGDVPGGARASRPPFEVNAGMNGLAIQNPVMQAQLEQWHARKRWGAVERQLGAICETFKAERALSGDWVKQAFPGKKATNHVG